MKAAAISAVLVAFILTETGVVDRSFITYYFSISYLIKSNITVFNIVFRFLGNAEWQIVMI